VCVAPSAGVRRCPVWLWRRPPRTPATVASLLSVACRPPPAASSHERARPRCSLLSSRLVLSAATVHSMESPAASPPASLPQTKGKSKRKKDLRIACVCKPPVPNPTPPRNLDSRTFITIGDRNFEVEADDLVTISELGRGAYGVVEKVRHAQSGTIMAVKRIRATVNSQEQKRLLMDLDINMRTVDCFYTVTFYGALFREGDVWICMELMDTSLDKFYRKVLDKNMTIPEDILGEIAVSIVRALEHLHSKLSVIHRGCEAVQRPHQQGGACEDVRLWHQWLPGGLCGKDNGCWLQALHGS
ncbi:Dual specificity mitogen-activated protein kinase kinase 3, partial [Lemmus lemmus]